MKNIIELITHQWFLKEPLLFNVLCSHKLEENSEMMCPVRCGNGKIQYNLKLLGTDIDKANDLLKCEIYRILLNHPYERIPHNPNHIAMLKASNAAVLESCADIDFIDKEFENLKLERNKCYEEYYRKLKELFPENKFGSGGQNSNRGGRNQKLMAEAEQSMLWNEDENMKQKIRQIVENASKSNQWGSVPGELLTQIIPTPYVKMDYVKILRQFKSQMNCETRLLTRMKPNRRYGFDYMGSKYNQSYSLIVAVDVSGSVTDSDLEKFFSVINRFFKYGVKKIKLLTFDFKISQELDFKKPDRKIKIIGRGGTDFQPVIDYYEKNKEYDGMIIFTDGYASVPRMKKKNNILWILSDKINYNNAKWIDSLPGHRRTWINNLDDYQSSSSKIV